MPGSADPRTSDAERPAADMVWAQNVSRRFGALTAVDAVSFRLAAGGIAGLVGSDGAGKTTLLRMVAGMIAPSAGAIRVAGRDTENFIRLLCGEGGLGVEEFHGMGERDLQVSEVLRCLIHPLSAPTVLLTPTPRQ